MIVVVGGHSRNIGKTAVMCGIISGLPKLNWTGVKITQYEHGLCSRDGKGCECGDARQPLLVFEEPAPDPSTDSGRYLVAGAKRSFWVRSPIGRMAEAMPRIHEIAEHAQNLILESNSVLGFLHPDRYVMVVDGAIADFKPSSRRFFDQADIVVPTSNAPLNWTGIASLLHERRIIPALAPNYCSDTLIEALRPPA